MMMKIWWQPILSTIHISQPNTSHTHRHVTISKKIKIIPRTTTAPNYALQLALHHEVNRPRVLNHANSIFALHETRVCNIGPKQVAEVGKLHIWEGGKLKFFGVAVVVEQSFYVVVLVCIHLIGLAYDEGLLKVFSSSSFL